MTGQGGQKLDGVVLNISVINGWLTANSSGSVLAHPFLMLSSFLSYKDFYAEGGSMCSTGLYCIHVWMYIHVCLCLLGFL